MGGLTARVASSIHPSPCAAMVAGCHFECVIPELPNAPGASDATRDQVNRSLI
jgi:hypothetical protein